MEVKLWLWLPVVHTDWKGWEFLLTATGRIHNLPWSCCCEDDDDNFVGEWVPGLLRLVELFFLWTWVGDFERGRLPCRWRCECFLAVVVVLLLQDMLPVITESNPIVMSAGLWILRWLLNDGASCFVNVILDGETAEILMVGVGWRWIERVIRRQRDYWTFDLFLMNYVATCICGDAVLLEEKSLGIILIMRYRALVLK